MSRKDNKINMPSSGGGLTRYFNEEHSKLRISPQNMIYIILAVIVIVLLVTGV